MPKSDDVTLEVTGQDAPIEAARRGSASSSHSPSGGDTSGLEESDWDSDARELVDAELDEAQTDEQTLDTPGDLAFGHLERGASEARSPDERSLTARPHEVERPITPDLLPSDDPHAALGDEDARRRAAQAAQRASWESSGPTRSE